MHRNLSLFDFFQACDSGDSKNVKAFLEDCHPNDVCADFRDNDNFNMSALMLASRKGYVEIVTAILNFRKDHLAKNPDVALTFDLNAIDSRSCNALIYAAQSGSLEICKLLVLHGADPRNMDDAGATPADYAVQALHEPTAAYLRDRASALNALPQAIQSQQSYRMFKAPLPRATTPRRVQAPLPDPTPRITRSAAKKMGNGH